MVNWPFFNRNVFRFYIIANIYFENLMILTSLWIFTDFFQAKDFFYILLLGTTLISGVFLKIWDYKYEKIMKMDMNMIEK